jgi:hypothetical protein
VLAGTPILVMAEHGQTRAAVRSADGHLWITHWATSRPDRVAGTRLEGLRPGRIGEEAHAALGGALPGGARSVGVRGDDGAWHPAHVGRGAWVAFVPWPASRTGMPPVRFLDAHAEVVSRAEPADLAAARALDGRQLELRGRGACPVCGAEDWVGVPVAQPPPPPEIEAEHRRRLEERLRERHGGALPPIRRARHQSPPMRILCRRCGHGDGGVVAFFGP